MYLLIIKAGIYGDFARVAGRYMAYTYLYQFTNLFYWYPVKNLEIRSLLSFTV